MPEHELAYSTPVLQRPSRWSTLSVWTGSAAVVLILFAVCCITLIVKPAYPSNWELYARTKGPLAIVPAWSSFALALIGTVCGVVGLLKKGRPRARAVIGLGLCLAVPGIVCLADTFRLL